MSRSTQTPTGVLQRRPDMATGTVKFFNSQKGFGFIQPSDGGKDVFVHISAVERAGMSNLNEGQKLTYDVVSERGKLAAANLQNVQSVSKMRRGPDAQASGNPPWAIVS